jgi:hypothetical protein
VGYIRGTRAGSAAISRRQKKFDGMCYSSSVTAVCSFLFLFHLVSFLQRKEVACEMSAVGLKSGLHSDKPAELRHGHTYSLCCCTDISTIHENVRKMKTEKIKIGANRSYMLVAEMRLYR